MKGHIETLRRPAEPQEIGSFTIETASDSTPVVIQLEFPFEEILLQQQQQQRPTQSANFAVAMNPRGMARTVAASYIGCSPRKFDYLVEDGEMPQPRMIGAKKVWDRIELDDFFETLPKLEDEGNEWDED